MSSDGFQAAFAHLLIDENLREALQANDPVLQRRFSLSDAEVRALQAFDRSRLQLMVDAVAGKRLQLLRRALRRTMDVLERDERGRALLQDFLRSRPPLIDESHEMGNNRLLVDARRLADDLGERRQAAVAPYLADLADYEALRIALTFNIDAGASASAALRGGNRPSGDWTPRLGAHVVLRVFEYDVASLASDNAIDAAEAEPAPRTTCVALRRQAGMMAVDTYRLGRLALETLGLCDGSRSLVQVCAEVDGREPGGQRSRRARATVLAALERGCFVPADGHRPRVA